MNKIIKQCIIIGATALALNSCTAGGDNGCDSEILSYTYSELAAYKLNQHDYLRNVLTYRKNYNNGKYDYIYLQYEGAHMDNLAQVWEYLAENTNIDVTIIDGMNVKDATVTKITEDENKNFEIETLSCPEEETE